MGTTKVMSELHRIHDDLTKIYYGYAGKDTDWTEATAQLVYLDNRIKGLRTSMSSDHNWEFHNMISKHLMELISLNLEHCESMKLFGKSSCMPKIF